MEVIAKRRCNLEWQWRESLWAGFRKASLWFTTHREAYWLPFRNIPLPDYLVVGDGMYVSRMDGSLEDFCTAARIRCLHRRNSDSWSECGSLIAASRIIQRERVCPLAYVFKASLPGLTYTSSSAKSRLLKIPLVCIRVGRPTSGKSELLLMEKNRRYWLCKIHGLWNANSEYSQSTSHGLSKGQDRQLLDCVNLTGKESWSDMLFLDLQR